MAPCQHSLTLAIPPSSTATDRRLGGAAAGHAGRWQGRQSGQGRQEGQGQHLAGLPALLRGEGVRGWAGGGASRGHGGAGACLGKLLLAAHLPQRTPWHHDIDVRSGLPVPPSAQHMGWHVWRAALCPQPSHATLPHPSPAPLLLPLCSTWAWHVWSAAPAAPATPATWTAPGSARCRCSRYICSRWAGRGGAGGRRCAGCNAVHLGLPVAVAMRTCTVHSSVTRVPWLTHACPAPRHITNPQASQHAKCVIRVTIVDERGEVESDGHKVRCCCCGRLLQRNQISCRCVRQSGWASDQPCWLLPAATAATAWYAPQAPLSQPCCPPPAHPSRSR